MHNVPLNHILAIGRGRIADTPCAVVTGVAFSICAGCCKIRVSDCCWRRIENAVSVFLHRRGGVKFYRRSRLSLYETCMKRCRSWAVFENGAEGMLRISPFIVRVVVEKALVDVICFGETVPGLGGLRLGSSHESMVYTT
jgi:hypothetical protein